MTESNLPRWKQRFQNYKKAFANLRSAVDLANQRPLSDLEKQGLIQGFEFTHELYWKTVKDFFQEQGNSSIYGSKDATREAFHAGLIQHGETWFQMVQSRNLSSHTYDNEIADGIITDILENYYALFLEFKLKMEILEAED